MKYFFKSLYIMIIDIITIYAGIDIVQSIVDYTNDKSAWFILAFPMLFIGFNTYYLVDKLINDKKEEKG